MSDLQKDLEDAKARIKELEIEENVFNSISSELYAKQRELDNIKLSIMPFVQLLKLTKGNLSILLDYISPRHSICDLVDGKSPTEIEDLQAIWHLCGQFSNKMKEIYKNP